MKYQPKNSYKIYSRPRLNLAFLKNSPKSRRSRIRIKKTTPVFWVIIIAMSTCFSIWNFINPIFESLCEDKAKAVATLITNEETTNIMKKYNYETFFTIEKDSSRKCTNDKCKCFKNKSSDIRYSIKYSKKTR